MTLDFLTDEAFFETVETSLKSKLLTVGGRSCVEVADRALCAARSRDWGLSGKTSGMLRDISWEKLHTGHWKDVNVAWRDAFALAELLSTIETAFKIENKGKKDSGEHSACSVDGSNDGLGYSDTKIECSERMPKIKRAKFGVDVVDVKECLRKLDMAKMMGGPLLAPFIDSVIIVLENYLKVSFAHGMNKGTRKEESCHGKSMDVKLPIGSLDTPKCHVRKLERPSLEEFVENWMCIQTPCIITNAMEGWPAYTKWHDLDYFRDVFGFRTVPVEVGEHYLAQEWGQQLMTISEFIDNHISSHASESNPSDSNVLESKASGSNVLEINMRKKGYLAQHPLFDQIPGLKSDIQTPDYCSLGNGDLHSVNAWFGPAGTVTPLHYDRYHNLLAQVVGSKYIRLYEPGVSQRLMPYDDHMMHNSSRIDLDDPKAFKKIEDLAFLECVLEKGEMLYIPPKWWHYVKSLELSFSVSFWWD